MLLANFVYVENPLTDFFLHIDSLDFYDSVERVLNISKNIDQFDRVIYEGRNWPAFAVISWLLGLFANLFNEGNSITLQKTQVVFYCALTIVFLYNMATRFLSQKQALVVAISFGLLTHILTFSGSYQRDMPIMMTYTIGFYIILSKWSFRNLIVLVLLGVLTMEFRFQHGISFILLIACYVFLEAKRMKDKIAYIVIIFLLICSGIAFIFLTIESYKKETVEKIEHYQDYHEEKFEESGGLTSLVAKLPVALQPFGNAFISQTYPMPPTRAIEVSSVESGKQWLKFPLIFAQMVWVLVWITIFIGLIRSKYRHKIPKQLLYSLLVGIFLLVAISTGSYEYRRMLCSYPVIYLSASFVFFEMHKKTRKVFFTRAIMFYIALILIYIFVKI